MADTNFVLAGSLAQARHFIRAREQESIKYVYCVESIYGVKGRVLYLYGAYDINKDWRDIVLKALTRNFKVIDVANNFSDFDFRNKYVRNINKV